MRQQQPPTRLEYNQTMTAEDIRELHAASGSTTVVVWSMQQPTAIDCLTREGKLSGDAKFAFVDGTHDRKRFGYAGMQEQMAKRIVGYKQELPIWAVFEPPSYSDRENDTLLRIEIPKSRMLISFYVPWVELQPTFSNLWKAQAWPDQWLGAACPYSAVDAADVREKVRIGLHRQQRAEWNEVECRESWERMFDLTLIDREAFLRGTKLQAMLPYVLKDDVKDRLPIPKRDSW